MLASGLEYPGDLPATHPRVRDWDHRHRSPTSKKIPSMANLKVFSVFGWYFRAKT